MPVTDYVARMRRYMDDAYNDVKRVQLQAAEEAGEHAPGRVSQRLQVGDAVLVRKPRNSLTGKRVHSEKIGPVPHRYLPSCYPNVYRINKEFGPHTFTV